MAAKKKNSAGGPSKVDGGNDLPQIEPGSQEGAAHEPNSGEGVTESLPAEVKDQDDDEVDGEDSDGEVPHELIHILEEAGVKDPKTIAVVASQYFRGPLPPPSIIQGYEDAYAGAAEIILKDFEARSKRRFELDTKRLDAEIQDLEQERQNERLKLEGQIEDRRMSRWGERRGQICAAIICLAAIGAGPASLAISPDTAGAVTGSILSVGGLVGLAATFIGGRQKAGNGGKTG